MVKSTIEIKFKNKTITQEIEIPKKFDEFLKLIQKEFDIKQEITKNDLKTFIYKLGDDEEIEENYDIPGIYEFNYDDLEQEPKNYIMKINMEDISIITKEQKEKELLVYSKEVLEAKEKGLPIVALESTIITHGMEYPINYTTATKVEETVRNNGAIPATIVIIKGIIHIGLDPETLKEISENKSDFIKCSTRDLPYALLKKKNGSTTVAATMYIAHKAGIQVFVTGGIGGVHYGNDMDISGDLIELSRTPVTVICAGAKSILDVPKTLEYLETFNVPVIGHSCDKFPEFFFANGDSDVKFRMDSDEEIAGFIDMTFNKMKMNCGILVAIPVPEEANCDKTKIKEAIKVALKDCENEHIKGNKITPYLLKKINDITKGESCDTNVKLILNNAEHGAKISKALNSLINAK